MILLMLLKVQDSTLLFLLLSDLRADFNPAIW
jgi:hypothetical protein